MISDFNFGVSFLLRRVWAVVIVLALLLVACSSVRFGYNHADTLIVARLDEYLDLDAEQEALAEEQVAALLAWHRTTQLRDYAAVLGDVQGKIRFGLLSSGEVLMIQQALIDKLAAIGDRAAPSIARLALTLKPHQLATMRRKLADDDWEFREEQASVRNGTADLPEALAKRFTKRAEFWMGRLTEEQERIVYTRLAVIIGANGDWAAEREQRRQQLLAVLARIEREKPGARVATQWIREYFAGLYESCDPKRSGFVCAWRRAHADVIAELVSMSTAEQRDALNEKLRTFAEDFATLAAEGLRERRG